MKNYVISGKLLDNLILKLNVILSGKEYTESIVMYILVEMVKILEILELNEAKNDKSQDRFSLIKFYRNWVVHSFLEGSAAQKRLEDDIEKVFTSSRDVDVVRDIFPFISFEKLKTELAIFIEEYKLPTVILEEKTWHNFLNNLINILAEHPLMMKNQNCLIKEFIFKPQSDGRDVTFEVILNNGGKFSGTYFGIFK